MKAAFGELAAQCGTKLTQVEPLLFGFATEFAILTVGAYPGHFRSVCVKIRPRVGTEEVSTKDGADIGLANIERFVKGSISGVHNQRQEWDCDPIRAEIQALAALTREVAWPFLQARNADWAGLREMIDQSVHESLADRFTRRDVLEPGIQAQAAEVTQEALFEFHHALSITGRSETYFVGKILSGTVKPGMCVSVPLNTGLTLVAKIKGIELVRDTTKKSDVALALETPDEDLRGLWKDICAPGEQVMISAATSD